MSPLQAKTFIVDDEQNAAQLLQKLLEPFHLFGTVSVFTNATTAFTQIVEQQPDFLFLDIQMPEFTGLQLAEKIKSHAPNVKVIYVTAYQQYALDALRQNAFDYLLKPVSKAELVRIVDKLLVLQDADSKTRSNSHLIVRSTEGIYQVQIGEIVYLEADCSYTTLFLSNGSKILSSSNLGKILPSLPKNRFIRISRKHLVNRKCITFYHSKEKYVRLESPWMEYKLEVTVKVNDIRQLLSV
jgi:two-component system, LytTR family, response regulator